MSVRSQPLQNQESEEENVRVGFGLTGRPLTVRKQIPVGDKSILSHLQSFDLYGRLTARSEEAAGQGAFSEVFRGRCFAGMRGEVMVAVKRLRFHIKSIDCNKVSPR